MLIMNDFLCIYTFFLQTIEGILVPPSISVFSSP